MQRTLMEELSQHCKRLAHSRQLEQDGFTRECEGACWTTSVCPCGKGGMCGRVDTSSVRPCWHGATCTRADCMFKHPENRVEVDHAVPSRRTTPCRYGARCTKDDCWFGHDSLGAPGASVCGSAPRVVAPRACAMPAAVSPWQAVVSTVSPTPDGRSGPAEASAIAPGALSGSAAAAGEACGSIEAGAGGASGSSSRLNGNAFAALASDSEDEFEDASSMWQTTSLRASCGPPRVSHPRGGQGPKRRMQSGRLPSGKSAEWGSGGSCSKWEPVPAV